MPQEDRGVKGDHPSEILEENGLVENHTIPTGDGIFLHPWSEGGILIPP